MNRNNLKKYAPEARRDFIRAVTDRASYYGLTAKKTEPVTIQGDIALISGRAFPKKLADQRKGLEDRIKRQGFDQVMEAMAYTWFNRLVAIRFMELHGYLDHGYRVLSHPEGGATPEIVEHAEHVDLPGIDKQKVVCLKLEGTKEAELYRMLLIAQCNALHSAMPFLFERIDDETELLLPDNLLHSDSIIRTLVNEVPEEDWQEVEIIGWLYQFYISEKKDEVIGKVVASEDIPAATQLFTPNWIVKYLVQNSLGRQWMATYPNSSLKAQMEYYIEPAEQTPEVQEQLKAITPDSLNPEELTLLDPACGSGHILVEAYDLLKVIYQERGYRAKDIPRLILEKNLYGLEIDDRAAQLAAFALLMKARADDRRILDGNAQPHVLAIQESKGLDAREITEALNQPIFIGETPPPKSLLKEIDDKRSPLFSKKPLAAKGDIAQAHIAHLIQLFEHGKTFGSLIRIPPEVAEYLPLMDQRMRDVCAQGSLFGSAAARALRPLIHQASLLSAKYDAVVMNPPYMGHKGMNITLKSYVQEKYPTTKADLFSAFIERGIEFCKEYLGMVTMHSWLFLSSFTQLRERLLSRTTLPSLAHLGARAFSEISGEVVQTAAFVVCSHRVGGYLPTFFRLVDGNESEKRNALIGREHKYSSTTQDELLTLPNCPVAYWASKGLRAAFRYAKPLKAIGDTRQGMATSDNNRFLRFWHEVDWASVGLNLGSRQQALASCSTWIPYNKGGSRRKWYGNQEYVINWRNDGKEVIDYAASLYGSPTRTIKSMSEYFKPCVSWSKVSTDDMSVRYFPEGFIFDVGGCAIFFKSEIERDFCLGLLNSKVAVSLLAILAPTMNYEAGHIASIPIHQNWESIGCKALVERAIQIAKADWDSMETSWNFQECPMVGEVVAETAEKAWEKWAALCQQRRMELQKIEEEINREYGLLYGLGDEIDSHIDPGEVTLWQPDRAEDVRRLISYAIGCMMGRFSLDQPGLVYAHAGNQGFVPSRYEAYQADNDGIVPLTDLEWFEDDASNRLEEFVASVWPKECLEENLEFMADSLAPSRSESPTETIRRYLATGFYKHHLSMYRKRPIYWLFSSGKHRAFQCLVYLHRYNEGTLARMRTEYVIPLSGKMASRIDQLEGDIAAASSTSHRKKLERERQTLVKQREELQAFDEQLRHYADQRIKLDLDDGVKVNYRKFGNLLAEVKAVTGGASDD